jgi:uncharacterized protein
MKIDAARAVATFVCRIGCGACCVAPSISSAIPGMPDGKPAGVRCIQLDSYNRCLLFGKPERPAVCRRIKPEPAMCGADAAAAMRTLGEWELATVPAPRRL